MDDRRGRIDRWRCLRAGARQSGERQENPGARMESRQNYLPFLVVMSTTPKTPADP